MNKCENALLKDLCLSRDKCTLNMFGDKEHGVFFLSIPNDCVQLASKINCATVNGEYDMTESSEKKKEVIL